MNDLIKITQNYHHKCGFENMENFLIRTLWTTFKSYTSADL